MAVTGFAQELMGERYGRDNADTGERTYRRAFRVICDNRYDGPSVALGAVGLPQKGFPYQTSTEFDPFALCREATANPLSPKSPFEWLCEYEYSTRPIEPEDPLLEPPDIAFDFENYREAVTGSSTVFTLGEPSQNPEFGDPLNNDPDMALIGIARKGIVNSAGEPFDPPAEKDCSRPILTIGRNELIFNPNLAIAFQDAVNSDVFFGAQPGQAKIRGISARRETRKNLQFWRVTYVIAFKKETWDLILLDHGSYHWQVIGGVQTKVPFLDGDGNRTTGLLNGNVALGDKLPANADAKFLQFKVYRSMPFAVLQLPQTIA